MVLAKVEGSWKTWKGRLKGMLDRMLLRATCWVEAKVEVIIFWCLIAIENHVPFMF